MDFSKSLQKLEERVKEEYSFSDKVNAAYRCYFDTGTLKEAEKLFDELLKYKPEYSNSSFLRNLADIKYSLNKKEDSLKYYGKVISILGDEAPKSIFAKLLKNYRELIKIAMGEKDKKRAIALYREMIGKYPGWVSQTDAFRFSKLIAEDATIYDKTLIQSVFEKKAVSKAPFENVDSIPLEIVGIIETSYKPSRSSFCPDGSIFTSYEWCRPPLIKLIRNGRVAWEHTVDNISRSMLTDETIVLLTGGYKRRVLSTYDFQGRLINRRTLSTSYSGATLNRSKTHYLLRTNSDKLNKCQFFIVSARGEFLWESQRTKGWTYQPSLIPLSGDRWLVADGPQCFVLDGKGNQLFEYTTPTEEKVFERIWGKTNIEVPGSSMPLNDHFGLLGIEPTQNKEIIKKAYHSKALQWHPDRNPDNPQALEMMKELNRVYSELIKSPISLSKQTGSVGIIFRYKVVRQDHFISAIVDPEGEECWLTSSYGLIYSFKQNTLTQVYSLKQRARIIGIFEHDRSLLIEQEDGLYIYRNKQLQQVNRGVGYGYRALYDPLNRYLILSGNDGNSLCFVDEKGRLGEVKFEHIVHDFDYSRKQNLITVAAGKIYFLRLRRSKKLVETQVTGDLVVRD